MMTCVGATPEELEEQQRVEAERRIQLETEEREQRERREEEELTEMKRRQDEWVSRKPFGQRRPIFLIV